MTLDTWADTIARPVMEEQFGLCIFFIIYNGLAVFVFWNLITAIVVESAMAISREDDAHKAKEAEHGKKRELKDLMSLFLEIDKDQSGELELNEFLESLETKKV